MQGDRNILREEGLTVRNDSTEDSIDQSECTVHETGRSALSIIKCTYFYMNFATFDQQYNTCYN